MSRGEWWNLLRRIVTVALGMEEEEIIRVERVEREDGVDSWGGGVLGAERGHGVDGETGGVGRVEWVAGEERWC